MRKAKKGKERSKFDFAGGRILNSIGAAWFAGFCYALFVDPTYTKWIYGTPNGLKKNRLEPYKRIAKKRVREFDDFDEKKDMNVGDKYIIEYWLEKILTMDKLETSQIGEKEETIKNFVRQILSSIDNYVFEGVLSEISTDGNVFSFKLKGCDGFYIKKPGETGIEKGEEYNVFVSGNYKVSRLLNVRMEFAMEPTNAFKEFLLQAFYAHKKVCLAFSAVGLQSILNSEPKVIHLDQILQLVKIP